MGVAFSSSLFLSVATESTLRDRAVALLPVLVSVVLLWGRATVWPTDRNGERQPFSVGYNVVSNDCVVIGIDMKSQRHLVGNTTNPPSISP